MTNKSFFELNIIGAKLVLFGINNSPLTEQNQILFKFHHEWDPEPIEVWASSSITNLNIDCCVFDIFMSSPVAKIDFFKSGSPLYEPSVIIQFEYITIKGDKIPTKENSLDHCIVLAVDPDDYPGIIFQEAK
jgi:hypothetical protein